MTAEDLLHRWAARALDVPEEDVMSVDFTHEAAWGSDSGTWWPEDNYAVVKLRSLDDTRSISVEGMAGLTGLIREILDSSDA